MMQGCKLTYIIYVVGEDKIYVKSYKVEIQSLGGDLLRFAV